MQVCNDILGFFPIDNKLQFSDKEQLSQTQRNIVGDRVYPECCSEGHFVSDVANRLKCYVIKV